MTAAATVKNNNRKKNRTGADGQQKKKSWLRRNLVTLILVGAMLVGLGIMAYPTFSNYWNSMHQSRAIMNYQQNVSEMDPAEYQAVLDAAHAYNARLAQTGMRWHMTDEQKADYESQLNIDGTGIMGYIQIPKIDIELPVYHGTDDAVLQTSIGHLEATSLPVGGADTHSVLSGHRGLPSSRLFTDLDQLTEGDTFTVTVLNETLTYEVDQIDTILPTDLSDLQIFNGKDFVTLMTCTPYGINTHRLLVRAHRIPNANGDARVLAEAIQFRPGYIVPFVAGPAAVILLIYAVMNGRRRRAGFVSAEQYMARHDLEMPVRRL